MGTVLIFKDVSRPSIRVDAQSESPLVTVPDADEPHNARFG
jgi:hypothetical protein